MKEKKNIDDLFKEGFKNFEATPSPKNWEAIEARLKDEDDRKVIPFWIKLGGIAALLALLFTIGNSIFNSPINTTPTPIVSEDTVEINKENNPIIKEDGLKTANEKVASEVENIELKTNENVSKESNTINNSTVSETEIAVENKTLKASKRNSNNLIKNANFNTNKTTGIANHNDVENVSEKNSQSLIKKEKEIVLGKEAVVVEKDVSENKDYSVTNKEVILKEDVKEIKTVETENEETHKKSIFDAINETSEEEVAIVKIDRTPDNRWEVTPNVGPVYYNTLSEGSSIDPSFADNSKNGDFNITYGVQVSYNLNKRLSVRSGISNVNLSYTTSGLELGTGPVAASTASIDYPTRGNVTIVVDKGSLVNQNPDGEFGNISPKSTSGEVILNQSLSYFEVPLELKYALLNKKFGINLIGGFSTLLLGDNEVSVDAGDFSDVLGEANNLSSLSFTTNLGLGFNYSFSKKLMFNVEPMFKYQLNPYTDSSVDFKPYYIGVYSGLSFKF